MDASGDESRAQVARKMFLSEAHMVGMLQHPNILPIYDAGEENGHCYIVTEHVHGARTLAAYCRPDNLLRVDDVVEIMFKCAKALHYAHIARRHSSRHQAVEHHADDGQRRAHHRLRHRAGRRLGDLAYRRHRRQPLVHVARAGAVRGDHQSLRHLLARRRDVRAADGLPARSAPAISPSSCTRSSTRRRRRFTRCAKRSPRIWRPSSPWRCKKIRRSATRPASISRRS